LAGRFPIAVVEGGDEGGLGGRKKIEWVLVHYLKCQPASSTTKSFNVEWKGKPYTEEIYTEGCSSLSNQRPEDMQAFGWALQ
jgi:hypothetical protein